MSDISKYIADLSKEKLQLLLKLSKDQKAVAQKQEISPRSKETSLFPLSFAQARLWFLDQLMPGNSFYNVPFALRLVGRLDVLALQCSLNEIIRRHETLRTRFLTVNGQATQQIVSSVELTLAVVDLQSLPKAERDRKVRELANSLAQQPFDLNVVPLMRVMLLRLAPTEHVLLFVMHHIISDGWSIGVFHRELAVLYDTLVTGKTSPLPELSIQYADFAVWQRTWLEQTALKNQLLYWQQQLADLEVLQLPTDYPRPIEQSFRGAVEILEVPLNLKQGLVKLSQQHGVTLFMTMLAAFKVLLHRYTGQTDIVVGSAIANRNRSEIEPLIGFFVNTLVLRTQCEGNLRFNELLTRVRSVTLGAYAHQDLPFERLVEELQPERHLNANPLFQVMFALQNAPIKELELLGLQLSRLELEYNTTRLDMEWHVWEQPQGLQVRVFYATDLFAQESIKRMLGHFQTLLEGATANPQQRLVELPILSAKQQQQLLFDWNDTDIEYPQHKCIHQLFEAQVERTPDAVALVFEDQQLTYNELNVRGNQLAHYLKTLGVKPDVAVGICVQRSLEMVVGVLGILKAGGAYVPLDPAYPTERLSYMLSNSQLKVLLTSENLVSALPEHNAQVVCLDTQWKVIAQQTEENLVSGVQPENLAYVIYTSGSTGLPKGVAMPQLSLVNLILWQLENSGVSSGAKTLQFSPISFDVSFQEMFSTWCCGGTLVLIADEWRRDATLLVDFLEHKAIERLFLPFVALQQLAQVAANSNSLPRHLREVITAGEQLQITPSVRDLFSQLPNCQLHNHYGPSESHVVTALTLSDSFENWSELPPIGRPIANTYIYILDQNFQLVPIGVLGELYIGGVALARGYLNRPELSAEKFIPNPFSDQPGTRLYKTGDQARYLRDGNIEFLGRIDNQVKIRGFRIELGEIEAALTQHPQVQETVVIAGEDISGTKRLIAYMMPIQERIPTISELRAFLKQKLPEYMVPSAIVTLDSLPLTPSGKVDRLALPSPEANRTHLSEAYVAPRSPVEEILVSLWAEILGLEQVGIHDNFFDVGGHSLLATQLISRVRDVLQLELPLRSLFEAPTPAQLAECIAHTQGQMVGVEFFTIEPVAGDCELPLSFAQGRLWFLDQLVPGNPFYNMPYALRVAGELDVLALQHSLNEIMRRHETLRTSFEIVDGQPTQRIISSVELTLATIDLQSLPKVEREKKASELASQQAQHPFDLTVAPLLRVMLLRLSPTEHVLLFVMHHIISDGWSIGVFHRELAVLYDIFVTGKTSPLPELSIQYADYAVWQREWLQQKAQTTQLQYWQQQLANLAVLQLPTDYPRPIVQSYRGAVETLEVPLNLKQGLVKLSQQHKATLFMTLLAAFKVLLHRYTGQTDIVVGSAIANRNRSEIEPLIGFFVNTLVLRTQLESNLCFDELLKQVREVTLGAYAHQDLPFERLVEELQPERHLNTNPLVQVIFALQNAPMEELQLKGLQLSRLELEYKTTRLDMEWHVWEQPQGLQVMVAYASDLFAQESIKRMLGHFQTLLEGVVANPQHQIWELPLLSATQQQQLLVKWNNTVMEYPNHNKCYELFEAQVERTPDAVALVFEDQQLTYNELNVRANQLAHYLQSMGVATEVLVGLCVERSIEMVVGLLGILKAGGVYVPIDPNYPQERLSFILSDAQVLVLLTQQRLIEKLPEHGAVVICLDTNWYNLIQNSKNNPVNHVTSDNLAYIIYTSGSTGLPKGVQISHGALVNFLFTMGEQPGMTAKDIVIGLTTFTFDMAGLELFLPISVGACLVIARREVASNGIELLDLLVSSGVTLMQATPATWRLLLEAGWPSCNQLKILCGGEALPTHLAKQLQARSSFLWHLYGPTETTIWSTIYHIESEDSLISIGRPIGNTQVYILDRHLQPVPIGVPGEVHIGGAGLARGYLNRLDLTAEKFIPNPFSDQPGKRLYKTGDLAHYLPNGNIELLSRIDHQVKIRGFRIELGEIEANLSQHSDVRQTVVIAREDVPGDQRLVAYIVPHQESAPTISDLRSFLKDKLPEYMIPSAIVMLNSLPLTPNGKLDREALPAPNRVASEQQDAFVVPRDILELQLAQIWEKVLNTKPVGVKDNFFDLGGHSVLAVRLIAEIQKQCGQNLPLTTLFQAATIEQLASILRQQISFRSWSPLVEIQPSGSQRPLFCVHPGGGQVFSYYHMAQYLGSEQPFYGFQALGLDGQQEPHTTIEDTATCYIEAMRAVQPEGPYLLAGWSYGGLVTYEMALQLLAQGQRVAFLALLDTSVTPEVTKQKTLEEVYGDDATFLVALFQEICPTISLEHIRKLAPSEQIPYIAEQLRQANLVGSGFELTQAQFFIKLHKAQFLALQRYEPKPYPGRVTLFQIAEEHKEVSFGPTNGWDALAAEVDVHMVPGTHVSMMLKPNVQVLAEKLKRCLEQAQAEN